MAMDGYITRAKTLIGIDDAVQDELLEEIQANTVDLYKAVTGAHQVPESHAFMIVEVMVKRYNRIGNEGMTQERQADLLHVFESSDFGQYDAILDDYYKKDEGRVKGGVFWL